MPFCSFKIVLAVAVGFVASAILAVSQRPIQHPSLFYSRSDVEDLRLKANTSHIDIYVRLRNAVDVMKRNADVFTPPESWTEFSRSWNEIYGNSLVPLAFYCVLNNSDFAAFEMAKTIITRFTKLKNWRCSLNLDDDVPVAHSLVAVATAYDFLWDRLDEGQRQSTASKLAEVTQMMYNRSLTEWWGRTYIQNHQATSYLALLVGALVQGGDEPRAWAQRAHHMLNRTMFLLQFVADGSLQEGVSYGSYTSRSLTQYIFLAKRHFGIDLTDNPWLKNHFWFVYRTILPSFDGTLGVADSNGGWFFGPESQLVFLDSMVMRNGFGNWLARQIVNKRKDGTSSLSLAKAHRFATLHTEFLFYDSTIVERPPEHLSAPALHVFEDWGVAVYGRGAGLADNGQMEHLPLVKKRTAFHDLASSGMKSFSYNKNMDFKSTFVSFKCGVLHGQSVNNMLNTRPWPWVNATGWTNFNPGHEHPDHGSFTFYPNGVPFITEALYGPKYTCLNNVISFGSSASKYFTGQLGDGAKWLRYKNKKYWKANGKILASLQEHGRVYLAGEYAGWYDGQLGLDQVYRHILLERPDVLLVCDVIFTKEHSLVNRMSAFFHNRFSPFLIKNEDTGDQFAEVLNQKNSYRIHWASSARTTISARSQNAEYKAEWGKRATHYINVTTPITGRVASVVYVLSGPSSIVTALHVTNCLRNNIISVTLNINDVPYAVAIASRPKASQPGMQVRFSDYVNIAVGIDKRAVVDQYTYRGRVVQYVVLVVLVSGLFWIFPIKKILLGVLRKAAITVLRVSRKH